MTNGGAGKATYVAFWGTTALLGTENHLNSQNLSKYLVSTKAEDLVYVDSPSLQNTRSVVKETLKSRLLDKLSSLPIKSGY